MKSRGSRGVLRTQKEEDEERQKILMDMNARALEKENPAKNERMLEAMKIAVTKAKQLAARAFQEDLIDRLPSVVEKEPLYQAGSLLDASARIYSFRVDATHSEAYDVRSKLGDNSHTDNGNKNISKDDDDDEDEAMNSDNEEDSGKKEGKDKAKKKQEMDEVDSDSDVDLEGGVTRKDDFYDTGDFPVYIEDPSSGTEDEQTALEAGEIVKKFTNRYDISHENCVKRRAKVPMVVYDSSELNDAETGAEFCSHLYSKATHNFDEGSSGGLLMQNAVTSKCGRRYMLHNNCRCIRDPWNEKNDGEELHEIWGGIEEAERLGPSNFSSSVAGSIRDDEQTSTISRNTSISQETTFVDTTASTSSLQLVQKNVEAVLEETLLESGNKAMFHWRRRLQKKLGIDSEQFIALLAHSLRDLDPFVRRSFVRQAVVPARKSYINRIADTKSGLTYAPIADELEPFEESVGWKIWKIRWDAISNELRSKTLRAVPGEHPSFNYFFARSSEQLAEGDNVLGNLPVFRSIIEIGVSRDTFKVTGDDQKALAGVLDTFRIGRGESLFKKKGDDFGRKIAQIPIATPMKKPEQQQSAWRHESTILQEHPRFSVPSESVYGRSTIPSRMDDNDSEIDAGGFSSSVDNDADMEMDAAPSRLGDFRSVTDDVRSVASKKMEFLEKPEDIRLENSMRGGRIDAASACGDLHFVDEKRVAVMAYSIVNDETHWKKRKLDKGEIGHATKGKPSLKPDKVERKKAKRGEEKEAFEIGDFDNMPLALIRDRQRQTKRPAVLVKREDEVLKVHRTRVAAELLYKPEQFCRLAHVFSGDWETVRFHRGASVPTSGKEERLSRMLRQNIPEDLDPEEAIKEHMSRFNDYFDDSFSEQRPASVTCSSEAFGGHNDDDLVSEATTQENDDIDSIMIPAYNMPTVKATQSFYSEVDSGAEEAEIFGVKYSVRQRRINAPAVKRAIGTILSNAKLDADALNAELSVARQQGMSFLDGLNDVNIVSEDGGQNSSFLDDRGDRSIELSAEEERLQLIEEKAMDDDPTCELRRTEVTLRDLRLAGRHTFSSVLAQLPSYLAGRTADDLSPINAFSVLLHLCNENNLELLQRKDDHGLIKQTEMGDFTIISARKNKVNRKRTASEC